MTRLSWHLKSFAWWLLLTGCLIAWCVFATAELVSSERIAEYLIGICMVGFVALIIWSLI